MLPQSCRRGIPQRWLRALILLGLGLILACTAIAPAAAAKLPEREKFSFELFDGEYSLSRGLDGHSRLDAVETFIAKFPDSNQNRGIIRMMPQDYLGVDLNTEVISVTDAAGKAVPYDLETDDGNLLLSLGDDTYLHGSTTFVIHYSQRDVVRAFGSSGSQEFYRDSIGVQLRQPVETARMRVRVAPELQSALTGTAACYVGPQNSTERCAFERHEDAGETVFISADRALKPRENITMAIEFQPGTFLPGVIRDTLPYLSWVPVGVGSLGVLGLLGILFARRKQRRAVRGDGVIIPHYGPPPGVDLHIAANVIGASDRVPQAAMIQLALDDQVRLCDIGSGKKSGSKFALEYLRPRPIADVSARILNAVFRRDPTPGTRVRLDSPDEKLTRRIDKATAGTEARMRELGLRKRVSVKHRFWWIFGSGIIAAGAVTLTVVAANTGGVTGWVLLGAILAVGSCVLIGLLALPRDLLTPEGMRLHEYLEGVRLYLSVAEEDRIRMLQSPSGAERDVSATTMESVIHLSERLLPLAVLWRVEKQWAQVLSGYYSEADRAPAWYSGSGGFDAVRFTAGIGGFTAAAAQATSWSESSSSSVGGASGGGFSGGGSGGGGVGGR